MENRSRDGLLESLRQANERDITVWALRDAFCQDGPIHRISWKLGALSMTHLNPVQDSSVLSLAPSSFVFKQP